MGLVTSTTNVKEPTSVLDRFTLKGKKAIVTGAAGGIGRATSMAFAELGADVAVVDIQDKLDASQRVAEEIAATYGHKAIALGVNVADKGSVDAMVDNVVAAFGTIDVVHSNAGIGAFDDGPDMDVDKWNRMLGINLTGVKLVDVACANIMKAHGHGGSIINTASISGHIVNPPYGDAPVITCYPTCKAAVIHLTKALALSYAKYGIRVNSVSPGYIWSGLHAGCTTERCAFEEATVPVGHYGCLDDVTGPVCLLATELGSYMYGTDIIFDGGLSIY